MQPRSENNLSNNSNSTIRTDRFYYGWVVLAAGFVIMLVVMGVRYSFGVFFKSLESEFGLSRAATSEIFSAYMLLSILFAILGGWAVDRYRPRIVFTVMAFFTGLSLFLTSQASAPWHLYITYSLLLAIGTGAAFSSLMATTSRWFIKRRGLAIGIVGSGIGAGMTVMSPVAAWLITSLGWQTSYLILGLAALFVIAPCALLLNKSPNEMADLPEDARAETGIMDAPQRQFSSQLSGFSLIEAAKTVDLWLLMFIYFLLSFSINVVLTHIVPHVTDLGIQPMQAALMLGVMGAISIPGTLLMGRLSDTIGRKQALIICAIFMAASTLWLLKASNLWMLYLFTVVFGFFHGGATTPVVAMVSDVFGLRNIGVIMAITSIGWGIGAAVGPTFVGYLFDVNDSYVLAFIILTITALMMAALTPLVKTSRTSTKPETT